MILPSRQFSEPRSERYAPMRNRILIFLAAPLSLILLVVVFLELLGFSDDSENQSPADRAFTALMTEAAPRARAAGESRYAYITSFMEADYQRFRKDGIEFWNEYPDDPRKFDWLILTTFLPVHYPSEMEEWSTLEGELGPNAALLDQSSHAQWQSQLEEFKQELLSSENVTHEKRRLLWSVELYRRLLALRNSNNTKQVPAQHEQLLEEAFDFVEWAQAPGWNAENPTQEMRDAWFAYYEDLDRVVELVLGWNDIFELTADERREFADRIAQLEDRPYLNQYREVLNSEGFYEGDWQTKAFIELEQISSVSTNLSYMNSQSRPISDAVLPLVTIESMTFPGMQQGGPGLTKIIDLWNLETALIRYRELGLIHFEEMNLDDQIHWLSWTLLREPIYRKGWDFGLDMPSWRETNREHIHWGLRLESASEVEAILESVLVDVRVDRETKKMLRNRRLDFYTRIGSDYWRHFQDRRFINSLLAEIFAMDRDYGSGWQSYANFLVSQARPETVFGYTDTELRSLFSEQLGQGSPAMEAFLSSYLDKVDLAPGAKVSISVPSLDGRTIVSTDDMRGKIVLIDNWDTDCAPCINAFPLIHDVYEEYRDRGFEVVSIAYDGESRRERIAQLKDRLGLGWETLNGEDLLSVIGARYGFSAFPNYMLLDREGRWVAGTAEMGNGANLETLLEGLLAQEKAGYYDRQPPIWTVSDEDTTLYLYGTLHSVRDHFDWLSDDAKALLETSDIIYTEVAKNTPPETVSELRETYAQNPEGETLETLLSNDQLTAARAAAEEAELGWAAFSRFKPGFAALELGQARLAQTGVERGESAEANLLALIDNEKQELRYFASFERQMQYMAELPMAAQINFLMNALEAEDTDDFDRLFQAWYWGDVEAIEAEAITEERTAIPAVYEALMVGRNREWANTITEILDEEQGDIFIAVGVGHLVGPDSVQTMLEDRGHRATRLY